MLWTSLAALIFGFKLLFAETLQGEDSSVQCIITRHPPFVTALLEEKIFVMGCNSSKLTPKSQEVHIISLDDAGPNRTAKWLDYMLSVTVLVKPRLEHSTHAGPLVVILHSCRPVMWHFQVERVDRSSRMVVVVTNGSELVMTTSWRPLIIINKTTTSLNKMLTWVKNRRFGAITSFSHIKLANSIVLRVGIAVDDRSDCDTKNLMPSQTVEAFYQHPVPTSGCIFHQMSMNVRDVHVVELNSSGSLQSEVTVHVEGNDDEHYSGPQKSRLLVLKSHTPLKWRVESQGIDGTISVVAESEVVAASVPPYLNLQAWPQKLPSRAAELIQWVTKEYGPIATYTAADAANRIVIVSSQKDQTVQEMQNDEQLLPTETSNKKTFFLSKYSGKVLVPNEQMHQKGLQGNWTRAIVREMSSHCTDESVHIAFPEEKSLSVLGVKADELTVTLKDLECQARTNGTHYVLDFSLTGCGAHWKRRTSGSVYSNQVLFWKYKTSKEGSSLGLENNITLTRLLLSLNYLCDFNITYDGSRSPEEQGIQQNMFKLQIFKSKKFVDEVSSFPMAVTERSYVFVLASVNAGPNMCVTIEDCWLSDNTAESSWKNSLIRSSCPNDLSVQFVNEDDESCSQRFSFQLSGDEFATRKAFLYCRLAACSTDSSKDVHKCVDPEEFCLNHSLRSFLDTSSYKHTGLEVRGPFTVIYKTKVEVETTSQAPVTQLKSVQPNVVVVVGLPMEVVVGIAFASFIIGAGLTAILWFIHQKTDPVRNKRIRSKKKVERSCDYEHSGHSGSSTPSSQAPMTNVHA